MATAAQSGLDILSVLTLHIQYNIINYISPHLALVVSLWFGLCVLACLFFFWSIQTLSLSKKLHMGNFFSEVVVCYLRTTAYSSNPFKVVIKLLLIHPGPWLLATTKLLQPVLYKKIFTLDILCAFNIHKN